MMIMTNFEIATIKAKIKQFIKNSTCKDLEEEEIEFNNETDIFKTKIVHSLFLMQLLTFLENEFNIEAGNDELETIHFNTVNRIATYVIDRMGASKN